jgi:hypothetical protein
MSCGCEMAASGRARPFDPTVCRWLLSAQLSRGVLVFGMRTDAPHRSFLFRSEASHSGGEPLFKGEFLDVLISRYTSTIWIAAFSAWYSRGPAEAGPFRSILLVVLVRSWREVHEPVHVRTIGKKPDDIASIVDPVDESTHHAECWCLRGTCSIELKESPCKEDEPVYIASLVDEGADDFTFVIAAER